MTFKEGVMSYLCFIKLCNDDDLPWQNSMGDDMMYEEDNRSKRHKERLILWAYKKSLFNTKDLQKGIWLTSKGRKYVEKKASDKDWDDARKLFKYNESVNEEIGE